jgi:phenylacetate-CoA ligase
MVLRLLTILGKVREYRRNEKLTSAEFEAMKLAKFRKLARHAQTHSPYYAQVMQERGLSANSCTPAEFPPLTKSLLMANFDRIVTDRRVTKQSIADFLTRSHDPNELFLEEFRVIHTSGSSGEIGYFIFSRDDWVRGMSQGMRRRPNATPTRRGFGRMRLAFYGAIGGHFAGVTMMSSAKEGIGRLFLKVGLYEVNDPLPATIAQLNEFQPDFLSGYTGALTLLAAKQREGLLRISPLVIGTAGESMGATDKKILEEAFGCESTNGYGSSEHLFMGQALPSGSSMLLYDDDLVYELFDDHCLVTNLFNYTLPLIRYRMSDILRPVAKKSDLASPYLEIESLIGRTEMMPLFVNEHGQEDFVSPHTINEIFVAGVVRFQMQLEDRNAFRFAICLDPALDETQRAAAVAGVRKRLGEILSQKQMRNVTYDVVVVDDIPVNSRSRKFQLIVDTRTA